VGHDLTIFSETTHETANIVEDIKKELHDVRREQKHKDIIAWLSTGLPDPSTEHEIARSKHEATTGAWLLESEELAKWIGADNSLLWLYGGGRLFPKHPLPRCIC